MSHAEREREREREREGLHHKLHMNSTMLNK